MTRVMYSLLVIVLAVSLALGCAKPAPAPPPTPAPTPAPAPKPPSPKPEPTVLKMVTFQSKAATVSFIAIEYAKRVNERAKGELKIDHIGGPEIIPMFDQPKALKAGLIDMLQTPIAFYRALLPEGGAHHISPHKAWEEREIGYYDWLVELHKEKMNAYYLGKMSSELPFYIWSKIPISRPQDLAGKMIISSGAHIPFTKALGMAPVTIPLPEQYTALERGVVDMAVLKVESCAVYDMYEQLKYYIGHGFYRGNGTLTVNLDKWNKLPKHLQDLMIEVAIETEREFIPQFDKENKDKAWQEVDAYGKIESITFSPEDAKWFYDLADNCVWDNVKKAVSPEGYNKLRNFLVK